MLWRLPFALQSGVAPWLVSRHEKSENAARERCAKDSGNHISWTTYMHASHSVPGGVCAVGSRGVCEQFVFIQCSHKRYHSIRVYTYTAPYMSVCANLLAWVRIDELV